MEYVKWQGWCYWCLSAYAKNDYLLTYCSWQCCFAPKLWVACCWVHEGCISRPVFFYSVMLITVRLHLAAEAVYGHIAPGKLLKGLLCCELWGSWSFFWWPDPSFGIRHIPSVYSFSLATFVVLLAIFWGRNHKIYHYAEKILMEDLILHRLPDAHSNAVKFPWSKYDGFWCFCIGLVKKFLSI